MKKVNVFLCVVFILLVIYLIIYEKEGAIKPLIAGAFALAFGYSKPVRRFREKYFKQDVKVMWLMAFNLCLLSGLAVLGGATDFKYRYYPIIFVVTSFVGVGSIVIYFLRYRKDK